MATVVQYVWETSTSIVYQILVVSIVHNVVTPDSQFAEKQASERRHEISHVQRHDCQHALWKSKKEIEVITLVFWFPLASQDGFENKKKGKNKPLTVNSPRKPAR